MEQILKFLKASSNIGNYFSDEVLAIVCTRLDIRLEEVSCSYKEYSSTHPPTYLTEAEPLGKPTKKQFEKINDHGRVIGYETREVQSYRTRTSSVSRYNEIFLNCLIEKHPEFDVEDLKVKTVLFPVLASTRLDFVSKYYRHLNVEQLMELAERGEVGYKTRFSFYRESDECYLSTEAGKELSSIYIPLSALFSFDFEAVKERTLSHLRSYNGTDGSPIFETAQARALEAIFNKLGGK